MGTGGCSRLAGFLLFGYLIMLMPSESSAGCSIASVKIGKGTKLQIMEVPAQGTCYGFLQYDDSATKPVFRCFPTECHLQNQDKGYTLSNIWRSEDKSIVTVDIHNVTEKLVGIFTVDCDGIIVANCSFILKTEDAQQKGQINASTTSGCQSGSKQKHILWIVAVIWSVLAPLLSLL